MVSGYTLPMDGHAQTRPGPPQPNRIRISSCQEKQHPSLQCHTQRNSLPLRSTYRCLPWIGWGREIAHIPQTKAKVSEHCWFNRLACAEYATRPCSVTLLPVRLHQQTFLKQRHSIRPILHPFDYRLRFHIHFRQEGTSTHIYVLPPLIWYQSLCRCHSP